MTTTPGLPEGLRPLSVIDGHYLYEETGTPQDDPATVELRIHPHGLGIEVISSGAPLVPLHVLEWIIGLAQWLRTEAGQ